jgi:dipeptidase
MASDMVVALARVTADGHTLFGHNSNRPRGEGASLVRSVGRDHAPGEVVRTTHVTLPQARRTASVLGGRAGASWGYEHGMNDKGLAAGWTPIRTRLVNDAACLTGPDLVRLALERASTALQAVEVLTDLIGRHGQGAFIGGGEDGPDAALLVADRREAYVLEAAGRHWALAAIGSVRAVSDACFLRQDWDRISRGLSDLAIHRGWWPEDGCKLDFAGAIGQPGADLAGALHRWGRATMQLEQHSGAIDGPFLRRLLREQAEVFSPAEEPASEVETAASLIVRPGAGEEEIPLAWYAFGTPAMSVYLPVLPLADPPAAYGDASGAGSHLWRSLRNWHERGRRDGRWRAAVRSGLAGLQQQLDELTPEFVAEANLLHKRREAEGLRRLAQSFMQHTCERFEELADSLGEHPKEGRREPEAELAGAEFS